MFSGSAFASAPLSTTTEIFTIPFLVRSSATCPQDHVVVTVPQRSENRAALVKAPTSPGALLAISLLAGHHGPSTFAEYITQSWWRAHQTRIAAKVPQMECLIFLLGPAAVFIGVSGASCSKSSTHPSLGHNLAGCPIAPQKWHVRPFLTPLAFPPLLPFPWVSQCAFLLPEAAATAGGCPPHPVSVVCPATVLPWKVLGSTDPLSCSFAVTLSKQS